jgi:hypothetical protein
MFDDFKENIFHSSLRNQFRPK